MKKTEISSIAKLCVLLVLSACTLVTQAQALGIADGAQGEERSFGNLCILSGLVNNTDLQMIERLVQDNAINGFRLDSIRQTKGDNCNYHFQGSRLIGDAEKAQRSEQFAAAMVAARRLDRNNGVLGFDTLDCNPTMSREASQVVIRRIAAGYRYVDQVEVANQCIYVFVLEPF